MVITDKVNGSVWADDFIKLNEHDRLTIKAVFGKENIRERIQSNGDMVNAHQMLYNALHYFRVNGHVQKCKRCGGSGEYIYVSIYGKDCFDCGGSGEKTKQPTKRELETMIRKNPNGLGVSLDYQPL